MPGPGHRECTPYLWPGRGAPPLGLASTEGLGLGNRQSCRSCSSSTVEPRKRSQSSKPSYVGLLLKDGRAKVRRVVKLILVVASANNSCAKDIFAYDFRARSLSNMKIQLRAGSRVLARLAPLLGAARSALPSSGRRSAGRKQLAPPPSARLAGQRNPSANREVPRRVAQARGHSAGAVRCRHRRPRPNPSVEARPNGKPPGPGRWYAVHFHRPGAWRLAVGPASPPTLGLAKHAVQYSSRISACRRELNSHDAAGPRRPCAVLVHAVWLIPAARSEGTRTERSRSEQRCRRLRKR